jgi:hypothetical protein
LTPSSERPTLDAVYRRHLSMVEYLLATALIDISVFAIVVNVF